MKRSRKNIFKQRFIGGPLDGQVQERMSDEGINDGFWWIDHVTESHVYRYHRQAGMFEDSDYVLVEVKAKHSRHL